MLTFYYFTCSQNAHEVPKLSPAQVQVLIARPPVEVEEDAKDTLTPSQGHYFIFFLVCFPRGVRRPV